MTEEQIKERVLEIARYIDEGWGIGVAKKKAIGAESSIIHRTVTKHPLYIDLLNAYIVRFKKNVEYVYDKNYKHGARLIAKHM